MRMGSQGVMRGYELRESEKGSNYFNWLLGFSSAWILIWLSFSFLSFSMVKGYATRQLKMRLQTSASVADAYLYGNHYGDNYPGPSLDSLCRTLGDPSFLDAWITFFDRKAEVVADSRNDSPLSVRPHGRPEVRAALRNKIGFTIRYSDLAHRRMAFLAYPRRSGQEVSSVLRIGVPYTPIEDALWLLYLRLGGAGLGFAVIAASLTSLVHRFQRSPARPD